MPGGMPGASPGGAAGGPNIRRSTRTEGLPLGHQVFEAKRRLMAESLAEAAVPGPLCCELTSVHCARPLPATLRRRVACCAVRSRTVESFVVSLMYRCG